MYANRIAGLTIWLMATFVLAGPALADESIGSWPLANPLSADEMPAAPEPPVAEPPIETVPAPADDVREAVPAPQPTPDVTYDSEIAPCAPRYVRRPAVRSGYGVGTGWDITAEAVIVSFIDNPEGILGEPVPAGVKPFQWSANEYDPAAGFRITIGTTRGRDRWEGRGVYWGNWDATSRQTGRFGFRATPGAALVLSPAGASATLTNDTDAWSAELNYWRVIRCDSRWRLSLGVGGRYVRIEDVAEARNWAGLAQNSYLLGTADNGFLGGQLLASARMTPSSKFVLGLTLKGLVGAMSRSLRERDVSIVTGGGTGDAVVDELGFSWGVEAELSVLYRLTRSIGLTASYSVLLLDEVGRAESVLDLSRAATGSVQIRDNPDTAILHAVYAGIRFDL